MAIKPAGHTTKLRRDTRYAGGSAKFLPSPCAYGTGHPLAR